MTALKTLGRADEVVFITHELTDDRRQLIRQGLIDVIIDQRPDLEVLTAVQALASYFGRNDHPPASLVTPVDIYMIENA